MSDTNDHNGTPNRDLPEDELVAAEYALGVLSGAERAAAEQRVAGDAAFALERVVLSVSRARR